MSGRSKRGAAGLTALTLAAGATVLLGAASGTTAASAAGPQPSNYGCGSSNTDLSFDEDEDPALVPADCAVGLPGTTVNEQSRAGVVKVMQTSAGKVIFTRTSLGFGAAQSGDRFGAAITRTDLDGNGYGDLVIGAPGVGGGRLYVVFGASGGLNTGRAAMMLVPRGSNGDDAGASLGSSLATHTTPDPAGAPVRIAQKVDLWAGAPGTQVSGRTGAGAVQRWTFTYTFLPLDGVYASGNPVVKTHTRITQSSVGVPGKAGTKEAFGSALVASGCGVVVGTPKDKIGSHARAGSISTIPLDPDRKRRTWSQSSAGVAGSAETGDRFGAALSFVGSSRELAVGAPRENVGQAKDAGSVVVLKGSTCVQHSGTVTSKVYRQGLRGALHTGKAETGDRFGTSITAVTYKKPAAIHIGAPGEDILNVKDAGSVSVFGLSPRDCPGGKHTCAYVSGRNGSAVAAERFGTTVRAVRNGDDTASSQSVVIGAPGFADGAGRVHAPASYDLSWIDAGPFAQLGSVPLA